MTILSNGTINDLFANSGIEYRMIANKSGVVNAAANVDILVNVTESAVFALAK